MGRSKGRIPGKIIDTLQDLIRSTKAANLEFATQLLQLAQLDILMSEHGIAAEEIDQLRLVLERHSLSGDVVDLEQLRRSRENRAMRTR